MAVRAQARVIADRAALLDALVALACEAGDLVWEHYTGECAMMEKADESPVTAADHAAEAVILAGLARAAPGVPVIAEEESAAGRVPEVGATFFLVDPLDGTREFVARGRDFTVNIGLIEGDSPTMGVVYAPAHDRVVWGDVGVGAWLATRAPDSEAGPTLPTRVRAPAVPPRAIGSRSHADAEIGAWLAVAGLPSCESVGSSLKFALIAAGEADVYPRIGPTMEWDTAAGDAVLRAAGGRMLGPDGAPFRYRKPGFRNGAFVATGTFDVPPIGPFAG